MMWKSGQKITYYEFWASASGSVCAAKTPRMIDAKPFKIFIGDSPSKYQRCFGCKPLRLYSLPGEVCNARHVAVIHQCKRLVTGSRSRHCYAIKCLCGR